MQLKKELRYCQCNDTPAEFRDRLLSKLKAEFSGYSIDALVCSPGDALKYCEQIRAEIGTDSMGDAVILKALMNIRKRSECPTDLASRSGRQMLKTKLQQLGIEASTKSFREQLTDCLASMYKSRTIDEMLCYRCGAASSQEETQGLIYVRTLYSQNAGRDNCLAVQRDSGRWLLLRSSLQHRADSECSGDP